MAQGAYEPDQSCQFFCHHIDAIFDRFKPHSEVGEVTLLLPSPLCVVQPGSDHSTLVRSPSFGSSRGSYRGNQKQAIKEDIEAAGEIEADCVDRSIRILPGVRNMIDSLPDGRYAVVTSGAKTYVYECMACVGITPPPITTDDKRLKPSNPAADPFLLTAF